MTRFARHSPATGVKIYTLSYFDKRVLNMVAYDPKEQMQVREVGGQRTGAEFSMRDGCLFCLNYEDEQWGDNGVALQHGLKGDLDEDYGISVAVVFQSVPATREYTTNDGRKSYQLAMTEEEKKVIQKEKKEIRTKTSQKGKMKTWWMDEGGHAQF